MRYLTLLALIFCIMPLANGAVQTLNFVPPSSNDVQQGFIRMRNTNSEAVAVTITGVDDAGATGASQLTLTIAAGASQQLNSDDIEDGNAGKGLTGALGDGFGNWRLAIVSDLDIEISGFIRTTDGFLTQVDAVVADEFGTTHNIPIFNPASNTNQVSKLRIINTSNINNTFIVSGVDDSGANSDSNVSFTLSSLSSVELTSQDLENGNAGIGLSGALGNGAGKWALNISSGSPAIIMNLLEAPGGYLSNLSNIGNKELSYETLGCDDLDGARIYSREEPSVYLGFLGSATADDSINNSSGSYGSTSGTNSVRNSSGDYGSSSGVYSSQNAAAVTPPMLVKLGNTLAYLSSNSVLQGVYSLATLDAVCSFTADTAVDTFDSPK